VLPAGQRLRRRREFAAAIRAGRREGRRSLVVHLALIEPAPDVATTHARAGFVIPRSLGTAVVRNKVRRRLRHLVRDRLHLLAPGATLVVRALPEAAARPYDQLGADLDRALAAVRTTGKRKPRKAVTP
jgi:ribonuclease P protein component